MAPTPATTLVICLLGAVLLSALPAVRPDLYEYECKHGEICCTECNEKCPGNNILCKKDCISPCINADICDEKGEKIAQGVANAACELAKRACNIEENIFQARSVVAPPVVDLTTCCKVVIGSCQGLAETKPCTVLNNDFGTCNSLEFQRKYLELVSKDCKTTVCSDNACLGPLANEPRCLMD